MKLLLDTNAFLWFITDDTRLFVSGKSAIADSAARVYISPASYWEIAIKISIGKYQLTAPFESFITKGIEGNNFEILPIEPKHTAIVAELPFHHRDPFDRLIIAQAMIENMPIVGSDQQFDNYPVTRIW